MATNVPYKSWAEFYDAFKCSLDTEYYEEEYPEYGKYLDEDIVSHLLSIGCDPQEGLDWFVDAVLFSSRYVLDRIDTIQKCMKILFDAGAKLDATKVFARTYDPSDATLEDEINNYESKAIIAMFTDPEKYVKNWNDIHGKYWEDIDLDSTDFETARLMHLKYRCDYLENSYIWN